MLAKQISRQARTLHQPPEVTLPDGTPYTPGVRYIEAAEFASRMYAGAHEWLDEVCRDWLVTFDDLGAARDKQDYLADQLFRLASQRVSRWTVWTTNLNLEEIKVRVDGRLASRLVRDGNKFVTIEAGDYALRKETAPQRQGEQPPEGWQRWLAARYPNCVYNPGGRAEGTPWTKLPEDLREQIRRGMGQGTEDKRP
jgi:hypothetical protein